MSVSGLGPGAVGRRVQERRDDEREERYPAEPRKREHRREDAACLELGAERREVRPDGLESGGVRQPGVLGVRSSGYAE